MVQFNHNVSHSPAMFAKYTGKNGDERMQTQFKSITALFEWLNGLDQVAFDRFDTPRSNGTSGVDVMVKIDGSPKIVNTLLKATNVDNKFSNFRGNPNEKMGLLFSISDLWAFLDTLGVGGRALLARQCNTLVRIRSDYIEFPEESR